MFVPLSDDNPLKSIPFQYMTVLLIAINVIVYAMSVAGLGEGAIVSFAVVPSELLGTIAGVAPGELAVQSIAVPERLTPITYSFFHADAIHLLGNMLFLWVFGDNVEDAMGHVKFLVFYLLCAAAAAMFHAMMSPTSPVPLIGASGGVAGVIAAYLMLHPRVRVWVLVMRVIPMQISAAFALGAWVLTQLVMVALPQTGPVAWWAHIGGLIAGAALILVMRRKGVPVLQ
ncbi:MAG: rhomboid family intramembrane serine protease [Pseudomonadota bacterium]